MKNELDFLIYTTPDERKTAQVIFADSTVWLRQEQLAELFGRSPSTISEHISSVYETGELEKDKTMTTKFGNSESSMGQPPKYYNLDMIISVGYRVNSPQATHFRIWATGILHEYMQKGFVLDDERLKRGKNSFGEDYFKEALQRIRSIRASERRIWLQITDIFAEISADYEKDSPITRQFYATVQNKFHYAIAGQTAAEIIYDSADRKKPNMGLTTWKNSPDGRILKNDTEIAKNYLSESQIKKLERGVSAFFDYVEDLIEDHQLLKMADFASSIDEFISFRKWKILGDAGKVSHQKAIEKAHAEYDEFNRTQKIFSDFEQEIKRLDEGNK
ncbi:MAG: virulence RhuM family protein [Candidatus Nomurabacteria bacterium]|jgi:hypothetical protein|nr:virulence RhuM family protein [Candidatus Nomurabacteria bacterium]